MTVREPNGDNPIQQEKLGAEYIENIEQKSHEFSKKTNAEITKLLENNESN